MRRENCVLPCMYGQCMLANASFFVDSRKDFDDEFAASCSGLMDERFTFLLRLCTPVEQPPQGMKN